MEIDDTYQTDLQLRKLGKEAAAKWGSEEACTISDAVAEVVKEATGKHPELPPKIKKIIEEEEKFDILPNDLNLIKKFIKERA
jgi:hypothetical protein